MSNILDAIKNAKNDTDNGSVPVERKTYDPKGNTHCFQKGAGPAWWSNSMKERNSGSTGELDFFSKNSLDFLNGSNANFDIIRSVCSSIFEDGRVMETSPKSYNLHRGDNLSKTLQKDVGAGYSLKPYREIVVIPNDVTVKVNDFNNNQGVLDYLQQLYPNVDVRAENVEIPINDLMIPWGCSCWSDGEAITFQYLIGEMNLNGDKYRKYLTIRSCTNGKRSTDYFITLVRVVCENTEFHADVEGWQSLVESDRTRARIRRNANMDDRIFSWHRTMSNAIIALSQVSEVFKKLASTKIAEGIAERDRIVNALICDSFDVKVEGKTKRGDNKLSDIRSAIFNRDLGGGDCETLLDLVHGFTAYTQHFQQVNSGGGKSFTENEKQEKLFMSNLMDDSDVKRNQQVFQRVFQMAG